MLTGKVAVVTGGNQGIGRAIAQALAQADASVALSARTVDSLERAAREIQSLGVDCLGVPCDVRDPSSTDAMAGEVLEHFGHVDVVIANAGIAGAIRPMHEITYEEWQDCLITDLDGVYLTFRRFIAPMIKAGRGGSLIAVSSMTGKRPLGGRTPYSAAKMGVIGLVRTLALELGPHGIRVNSVCPGAVDGARIKDVVRNQARAQGLSEEDALGQLIGAAPPRRLVR